MGGTNSRHDKLGRACKTNYLVNLKVCNNVGRDIDKRIILN
jgi:hypothetical protein